MNSSKLFHIFNVSVWIYVCVRVCAWGTRVRVYVCVCVWLCVCLSACVNVFEKCVWVCV